MKHRQLKEIQALADKHGMQVQDITQNRHIKVSVVTADGRKGTITYPLSPSDHRTSRAQETQWRHLAQGRK